MAQNSPSRRLEQYIVRFPAGMRDRLKDIAASNNRSLNAEIISRLERSLDGPDTSEVTDTAFWRAFIEVAVEKELEKRMKADRPV